MIVGIEGNIGDGKTLAMTKFAKDEYVDLGKTIFANYRLKQIPYEPLVFEEIMKRVIAGQPFQFFNAALFADEIHLWLDSRVSSSKMNRFLSYFLLQTGKLDVNLYYTTQDFGQVDKRLRHRTDIGITVKRKGDLHLLFIRDWIKEKNSRAVINGPDYWEFYDTREVVKLSRDEHKHQEPQIPRKVAPVTEPWRDPVPVG